MAFGTTSKEMETKRSANDGEQKIFVSPWMPTCTGTRTFRILPAMDADSVLLTPRLSPNSNPLREGNKKTGNILVGPEPAEETAFLFAWWQVMVNGELKPRRLVLDIAERWSNPLWKYIEKNYAKDAPERKLLKAGFALNVFDISPVVENDQGTIFYADEQGVFNVVAMGTGKVITDASQLPAVDAESHPLNKVRILEGSYGQPNGKHLFQQLADLVGSVEDTEGLIRRLPEFDLRLAVKGSKLTTMRTIRNTSNFKPLDPAIAALPRYNLQEWLKPWDNDAITALLGGEDYDTVVQNYGIQTFPKLTNEETSDFD